MLGVYSLPLENVTPLLDERGQRGREWSDVCDDPREQHQPAAIEELERRVRAGERDIVLLGATGTGKSATTAWLIERLQRPTLVMAPNKTLAAQLYNEFKGLFPENAVRYFVSYYDYYQPEAYVPSTDTYIEKDSSINDEIGLVCLELDGKRLEIKNAIKWLEKQGVKVEPIEINVIES